MADQRQNGPIPSDVQVRSMAELQSRSELLDGVNSRLLRELHDDPRITMSALARRVGMSAPAVTERVQRLQRSGVITGFRMEVDPAALGLPVTAFARIRPTAGQLDPDRRPGPGDRPGQRVSPDHRRGLLPGQGARGPDPGPGGGARPLPAVRADGQLHRGVHSGATAAVAVARGDGVGGDGVGGDGVGHDGGGRDCSGRRIIPHGRIGPALPGSEAEAAEPKHT